MGGCLNRDDYEEPSELRSGIPNIGNTCYMNSVVQALAGTPNILKTLENAEKAELNSLENLIKGLNSRKSSIKLLSDFASDFKDKISKAYSMYEGARENDAKELLSIILSFLDEEKATNPFSITYKNAFKCNSNHDFSNEEKSNFIVIPKGANIKKYFKKIGCEKKFTGNNKLYCEECKELKDTTMRTEISKYPQFLVLYTAKDGNQKNNTNCVKRINIKKESYVLYAVICYDSTIRHFYTYEKTLRNSWCIYNDDYVREEKSFPENKAYLLFYKKINKTL